MKKVKKQSVFMGQWMFLASMMTISAFVLAGCGANEGILKSGKDVNSSTNAAPSVSTVESEVAGMRTADFKFIYVLRRKDGGVIDAEDKGVIRQNTGVANRRVASDNDKAFVVGSNFAIPPDKMMALYDRFAVENYSPPAAVNTNSNVTEK